MSASWLVIIAEPLMMPMFRPSAGELKISTAPFMPPEPGMFTISTRAPVYFSMYGAIRRLYSS